MPPKRKHEALVSRWEDAKKRRLAIPRPLNTNRIRVGVDLGRGPMPSRAFVWMKYNEAQTTGAANFDRVYNANSIFDPDETGGGHRPVGYDQFNTFYNRYRVWGVRVSVIFAPKPSVTSTMFKVGVLVNNSISLRTEWDNSAEQQELTVKAVSPQAGPVTITKYYNLRTILGQTKEQYRTDDRFQALFSANPSERMGIHFLAATMLGAAPGSTVVDYDIKLEYRVELFDPHPLATSAGP